MKLSIIIVLLVVAQFSAKMFKNNLAEQGNDNFSQNKSSLGLLGSYSKYMMKRAISNFGKETFSAFVDTTVGTTVSPFQAMSDEFCGFQNKDMEGWSYWNSKKVTRKEGKKFRSSPMPASAEDKKKADCLAKVIATNVGVVKKLGEAYNNFKAKMDSSKKEDFEGLLKTYKSEVEKIDPKLAVTNTLTSCLKPKTCKNPKAKVL